MNIFYVLIGHLLQIFGFLLALFLLVHILRERRAPSTTIAWLLVIILVPYVGVPAYIIFGGRKMKRMTGGKEVLTPAETVSEKAIIHGSISTIFPQRKGTATTFLSSGEEAFAYLLNAIKTARQSIYITTFIFKNDIIGSEILQALTKRAQEGLDVCLLVDDLGSFKLSKKSLSSYKAAGGKYAFFMPMLHIPFRGRANLRNHRKIIIIDNATAIIGGMNIAREYMGPSHDTKRWNDISMAVQGPVVNDFLRVFISDWKFASQHDIAYTPYCKDPEVSDKDDSVFQVVPSGPDIRGDAIYDAIVTMIFTARQRIWIVTPYFIPDEMMLKALCIAAAKQVDVRLIVPLKSNHGLADLIRRSHVRTAQQAGVKIYFYKPGMLHSKLILIDAAPAIIGSMNMDMRSFFLNYEIAMFMYSPKVVTQMHAYAEGLMQKSNFGIVKTSLVVEFLESIFRLFAPLL